MQRRQFIAKSTAASLGFLGLQRHLLAGSRPRVSQPYGPLLADSRGLLDLPEGFQYKVISQAGALMDDGFRVPAAPDGMACFSGENGKLILVRNHELGLAQLPIGQTKFPVAELPNSSLSYDSGNEQDAPYLGGTSTLVYDPKEKRVVQEFLSLTGTDRNCAGGAMPWGSWITCEEPSDLTSRRGRKHGYCFEVKALDDGKLQEAIPLKQLGRFRHEAVALDPITQILYLTEDMGDGLLYRFVPEVPQDLTRGKLQALCIKAQTSCDLRNYPDSPNQVREQSPMEVTWVGLDDIDSPKNDLRHRGHRAGAAVFARGEGIQYSNGSLYICCTDGGPNKLGQIYKLTPAKDNDTPENIELFLQPQANELLTNGDNLCAAPWGDLIICEDLTAPYKEKHPHLRGVTPEGHIYTIARNAHNRTEFAGSCFSPDGSVLFVNMQGNGLTLAITGPWPLVQKEKERLTP